ncbi:N-acetyltransferase B complex, non-catalytic subunit [Penicillium griseofulvum]|uniref:60S ribosomal protein L36 n=1 Tax=Penicillium patulum TaxID=5078 RepID=A0A135LUD6_PENPA|nr:N-acetyltransferase B complex, non-catalytic subunit [Penicillium griseofulvum]KXG52587.1 N-acetyltransferase B complex, non-catalytic subunit [Penicillium griseofulvum]
MSSSNDAVFLRRNNQIQDAIDSQNMKQALQLIEKRMKKGENTQFLKASDPYETHKKKGIAETLALCNVDPPISDLDSLDILHRTLQKMDDHTELRSAIWERAAKAKPQDHALQMRWFMFGYEAGDWKSAQKAAMSLQKNFPRERKYFFWAIFLCYLVSNDAASSDMDRKLFGTLAYRFVQKAVADVPSDPTELLSPTRAIQTAEELLLVIRIFESQYRWKEIVQVLNSDNVGLSSRIVNNDRTFMIAKVMALGVAGLWEEGYSYTKSLLTVPDDEAERNALHERDDWKYWNLLIAAARHLDKDPGLLSDTQQHIEKFIEFSPKSRNAHIALMDVALTGFKRGVLTEDDLVAACQRYFDQHKHKLYAFKDLRGVLETRDDNLIQRVSQYCMDSVEGKPDDAIPLINAYKMQYCDRISGNNNASKSSIETIVRNCLDFYDSFTLLAKTQDSKDGSQPDTASAMESRPTDDFCIIAAMALLQPSPAGQVSEKVGNTALIRAAGILERLLIDSPHNYEAILMLIRIYLLLGAGSIALRWFGKLSVKQMQYESVAHNLFTRFATIHPHAAPPIEGGDYKDFDAQVAFIAALDFYRNANFTIKNSLVKGLEDGVYVNLDDTIELQRRVRDSICRRMWALDLRRMQRIRKGNHLALHGDIAQDTSPVQDQRKYDGFMNLERCEQSPFEHRLRAGPLPGENWLASARLTDRLFGVLESIGSQKPVVLTLELPNLAGLSLSQTDDDHTDTERDTTKIHVELLKVALFMAGSKAHTSAEIETALGAVEDWLKAKREDLALQDPKKSPLIMRTTIEFTPGTPGAPTWEYFHGIWTLVETLKALWNMLDLDSRKALKTAKLPAEQMKRLDTLVREVFEDVRSNTRSLKQSLAESATLSTLIDLVKRGDTTDEYEKPLQDVMEKVMDESALELFCGELRESWEEALDGSLAYRTNAKTPFCGSKAKDQAIFTRLPHLLFDNLRQPLQSTTVEMAERSGIVVGLNAGRKTTALNTPKTRISRTKGKSSRRTAFVREIAQEVVGLAPYERRIIELLRNAQDKRARKLAKKRLGTFGRGKAKVESMQKVIAESRRTAAH